MRFSRRIGVLFSVLLLSVFLLPFPVASYAADNAQTENAAPETPAETSGDTEQFEYLMEGRNDPFVPFITETAATSTVDMNEIIDEDVELTGMQLFEPGQLTLVAIMSAGDENYAMVQDFTGKGYVISEGTKIGRRGVITDIAPNKVLIEETAETRAGKKIVTKTVMVLKKEGEE